MGWNTLTISITSVEFGACSTERLALTFVRTLVDVNRHPPATLAHHRR
jgi:hypothetical protein